MADIRAPTPTAAAELCVPVRQTVILNLKTTGHQINTYIVQKIQWLFDIVNRIRIPTPIQMLEYKTQYLDDTSTYLENKINHMILLAESKLNRLTLLTPNLDRLCQHLSMLWQALNMYTEHYLEKTKHRVTQYEAILSNMDIPTTLKRGFCIPRTDGHVLTLSQAQTLKEFELQFYDGILPVIPK